MSARQLWWSSLIGWLLFLFSAIFFVWGALSAADPVSIIASLLFLVGCLIFLYPFWKDGPPEG